MKLRAGLLLVVATLLLLPATVGAATSPGPGLAVLRIDFNPPKVELIRVDGAGGDASVIAGGTRATRPMPEPESRPAFLPDGSSLIVAAWGGSLKGQTDLFQIATDGNSARRISGTKGALAPVLAPDGHTFAFARERERRRPNGRADEEPVYESYSVWLGDLTGGSPRQITPWRNRLLQSPSSFSPDGMTLAVTRLVADRAPEAIGLKLNGGADSVLARNAAEPVYSPDGSKLAFLRGGIRKYDGATWLLSDLYVKRPGGGGLRGLTNSPRAMDFSPSWDPSGQRLAWIEWNPFGSGAARLGFGNRLMQANPDGSCRTETLSYRREGVFTVQWQPGPGREAGPISC